MAERPREATGQAERAAGDKRKGCARVGMTGRAERPREATGKAERAPGDKRKGCARVGMTGRAERPREATGRAECAAGDKRKGCARLRRGAPAGEGEALFGLPEPVRLLEPAGLAGACILV
jgi:hypothetical protein